MNGETIRALENQTDVTFDLVLVAQVSQVYVIVVGLLDWLMYIQKTKGSHE